MAAAAAAAPADEGALQGDGLSKLSPEELAALLRDSLPMLKQGDDPDKLKNLVTERCITNKIDGKKLLDMVSNITKPGKSMTNSEVYKQLFDDTEELFKASRSGVRHAAVFAEMVMNKLILANLSMAIAGAETQVFSGDMIPKGYRNPEFDSWYKPDEYWCIEAGPAEAVHYSDYRFGNSDGKAAGVHGCYIAPAGWMRFALDTTRYNTKVPPEEWSKWHKAYHGTAGRNVAAIVKENLKFMPPEHGSAGAGGKQIIYASPCIEYSAHWLYTTKGEETGLMKPVASEKGETDAPDVVSLIAGSDMSGNRGAFQVGSHFVQWVFEVRVKPGCYRVQGNTLGGNLWGEDGKRQWGLEFDKYSLRQNLEWLIESDDHIICTAVMMRDIPCEPKEHNRLRYEAMKRHVQWDGKACFPTRPRDFGGNFKGKAVWDCNSEKAGPSAMSRADDAAWTPFAPEVSKVIEDAYQGYQRFVYLGKPEDAPGPYFIDFGNECDADLTFAPEQRRADADKEQAWRRRAVRRRTARPDEKDAACRLM